MKGRGASRSGSSGGAALGGPALVEVRELGVVFPAAPGADRPSRPVERVDFTLDPGGTLGIVGASGAGKSLTALALLGLVPPPGRIAAESSVRFQGRELVGAPASVLREVRGAGIGMVFQDPTAALNPVLRVGEQIAEVLRVRRGMDRRGARAGAVELLEEVGVPDAASRAGAYPHEFSGGMRQRVVLACAVAADPALLVADEPTSALDLTVQARILELLDDLRARRGMALLLVSHDLAVVAERCERAIVMRGGRVVEHGPTERLFGAPTHPHTRELVSVQPTLRVGHAADRGPGDAGRGGGPVPSAGAAPAEPRAAGPPPLLELDAVTRVFPARDRRGSAVTAVRDLSLSVRRGETLALVGASGSGKTTAALLALGLLEPTSGSVRFDGRDVAGLRGEERLRLRRRAQLVFQDGYGALDPRQRVGDALREVLRVHGLEGGDPRGRVRELLERVELPPALATRRPAALSGGERQRVGIARALTLEPELLVLDEPVAALDVAVQARVMALLAELREALGLTVLLVAHDLALVASVADRVAVMESGALVEEGAAATVLGAPSHAATRRLLDAHPAPLPGRG